MIRVLRRKFIGITMASVVLVLFIIMSVINIINYRDLIDKSDAKINMIAKNENSLQYERTKGSLPPGEDAGKEGAPAEPEEDAGKEGVPAEPEEDAGKEGAPAEPEDKPELMAPDRIGPSGHSFLGRDYMTIETPFNTRYYSASFDADGNLLEINTERIAAVTEDEAKTVSKEILQTGRKSGFYGNYRYKRIEDTDGGLKLIFLDCTEDNYSFRTFLLTSILVSLGGAVLVFLLVFFVSGIVVKPIAESYEKQKRFITDASHEIKTPLGIISANTEVIEMESGETQWTRSVRRQVERLTSLTEKLVFLSRMEEEGTVLNMIEFSLSEALEDTLSAFLPVAEKKGLFLAADIEKDIMYKGDEGMIRQMFSLLTDNAAKYSKDKGTIKVNMRENGKKKVITFWNSVDEIEKGDLSVLFERFYRKDSSRSTKTGGHGIGLSVVKEIVRAHKGKISAESRDGKSILFTIIL